jgi:hypothetical protein
MGLTPHGRTWRMVTQEWPKVRQEIDAGHPSPLGVVKVKSVNPFDLKHNHQVLAYGYDLVGSSLTLRLYDPNQPGRDDVTLSLSVASSTLPAAVTAGLPGSVFAFFRVTYTAAPPP